jgi:peptide-methionine (S)-S-oxide reductase
MRAHRAILAVALAMVLGYAWLSGALIWRGHASVPRLPPAGDHLDTAIFAAGCFWCVEADFDVVPGVVRTTSGYTGGHVSRPTYQQVVRGYTGHAEAVEVLFDPRVVSYDALLEHYWRNVDPFTAHRQFCDIGSPYRPMIVVRDAAQREAAERSLRQMQQRFDQPILVTIAEAGVLYPAEAYHQDYARTHPLQYRFYRWRCGRDARLSAIGGAGS